MAQGYRRVKLFSVILKMMPMTIIKIMPMMIMMRGGFEERIDSSAFFYIFFFGS